ncbi:hypothetical protein [Vibrio rumoiensis]|uniref:hypothetical protein n=1 Tax=Vibrio rumoiensis TaxID=76258 RepID=UPI000D7855C9|nr:hypothetical protein [Vibrio rumoiensis]
MGTVDGVEAITISFEVVQGEDGEFYINTTVDQALPLDNINKDGDTSGYITNDDDVISVDLPLEISDTDGDTSNIDITVNLKDGQDPSFGDNTDIAEINETDDIQTAKGSIEFDEGSDQVDEIVFDPNQPSHWHHQ